MSWGSIGRNFSVAIFLTNRGRKSSTHLQVLYLSFWIQRRPELLETEKRLKCENMRVFVTGATGFVGSVVVRELIDNGHEVIGLTRSDSGASDLVAMGAQVHHGSLTDLKSLQAGAAAADGVIHCAFVHDWKDFANSCEVDEKAIDAMGATLAGTGKPFIATSGTLGLAGLGRFANEDDKSSTHLPRRSETVGLALAKQGIRAIAIRLPPTVHGEGDKGFVPMMIDAARAKGVAAYVGDGANRWPSVHRKDAARAYRLALESAPAGTMIHAVADEGVPMREIAGIIGKHLKVPVESKTAEEAQAHFGFLSMFVAADNPTSSARSRELLKWKAVQPGLLEDLDAAHYFAAPASKYSF